jgi:hypothetical protein
VAGAQGANAEVEDIIAAKGQFVASSSISANATSVSKVYDVDRRAGDIIQDIARLGNSAGHRWIARMMNDRRFIFAAAARASREST